MISVKKKKTPDTYQCGHMRGPGWHDWRACLSKQLAKRGVKADEWMV